MPPANTLRFITAAVYPVWALNPTWLAKKTESSLVKL